GHYNVEYRALAQPGHWSKRKLGYVAVTASPLLAGSAAFGSQTPNLTPHVEESSGDLELGSDGHLQHAASSENISVSLVAGSDVRSRSRLQLDLEQRQSTSLDGWDAVRAATTRATPGAPLSAPDSFSPELDRARVGSLTLDAVVSELEKSER